MSMNIVPSEQLKKTQAANGTTTSTTSQPYKSAEDKALANGASIFAVAGLNGPIGGQKGAGADTNALNESDASEKISSGEGAKSETKNLGSKVQGFTVAAQGAVQTVMSLFASSSAKVNSGKQLLQGLNSDAIKTKVDQEESKMKIDELQSEKASLTGGDNTGVGAGSAFSLKMPAADPQADTNPVGDKGKGNSTGKAKQNSPTQEAPKDDPNAQKIADLDSQIASESSNLDSSSAAMANMAKTSTSQRQQLTNQAQQAGTVFKTAATNQAKNAAADQTITTIGGTTETAGQGTKTVGGVFTKKGTADIAAATTMLATPATAAAGGVLMTKGVGETSTGATLETVGTGVEIAGAGLKAGAQVAAGDIAGALTTAVTTAASSFASFESVAALKDETSAGKALAAATQKANSPLAKLDGLVKQDVANILGKA